MNPFLVERASPAMKKNVGSMERAARGLAAIAMIGGAFLAPVPMAVRVGMGMIGVYVLFTALAGTCLGYVLWGLSTCRVENL